MVGVPVLSVATLPTTPPGVWEEFATMIQWSNRRRGVTDLLGQFWWWVKDQGGVFLNFFFFLFRERCLWTAWPCGDPKSDTHPMRIGVPLLPCQVLSDPRRKRVTGSHSAFFCIVHHFFVLSITFSLHHPGAGHRRVDRVLPDRRGPGDRP